MVFFLLKREHEDGDIHSAIITTYREVNYHENMCWNVREGDTDCVVCVSNENALHLSAAAVRK